MKKGKLKKFTKVVESLEHEPVEMKGNKDLKDYAGMNPEAAKVMGWPDKDHAIELDEHQSEAVRVKNLVHETVEQEHMKQGDSYHDAHIEALKAETTIKTPEQLVNKVKEIRDIKTPIIHPLIVKTVKPIGKRPKIKTTPRRHHTARNLGAGIVETRTKGGRRRHLKLT